MHIYCVHPSLSKNKKQLLILLKTIDTNVVPMVFNYVLFHVHAKLLPLLMLVLHASGTRGLLFVYWVKKATFVLQSKCDDSMLIFLHLHISVFLHDHLRRWTSIINLIKSFGKEILLMLTIIDVHILRESSLYFIIY